jgi:hypothetical protein
VIHYPMSIVYGQTSTTTAIPPGFEPVDPERSESVSAPPLVVGAYMVLLILLFAYVAWIGFCQRKLTNEIRDLSASHREDGHPSRAIDE